VAPSDVGDTHFFLWGTSPGVANEFIPVGTLSQKGSLFSVLLIPGVILLAL
jgi:hypothetical protein